MKKRIITLVAALGLAMLPAAIASAGLTYDAGTEVNAPSGSNPSVFGSSIAISSDGSTLVVGDPGAGAGFGAAFVYQKSGSTWNNVATLTTTSGTPGFFGWSITVSADGSTVVVGDPGAGGGPGAAFVYQRPTSGWATTTAATASLTTTSGTPVGFGNSITVSADGSTVAVGNNGFGAADTAFVYEMPTSGWATTTAATATLTTTSGTPRSFGWSITISADGSTVVVGDRDAGGGSFPGAAFLYQRPTSGWATTTTATATLTTTSGTPANFGNSIAVSADGATVVVGDPDAGGGSFSGATFLYQRPTSGWATTTAATASLTTTSGTPADFGWSIAVSADGATVVVGDRAAGGGSRPGAAFVYQGPTSGWATATTATATLTTTSGTPADFGSSITISADALTVVVGDPNAGSGSGGAAFVFHSTNVAAASVLVAGSLAVQPQNIPFPSANVGLTDVTVSYDAATGTDPWRVRGDASTWSVTLQVSGDFSNGAGGTIPVDAGNGGRVTAQIEAADITGGTGAGTNPTSAVTSATALSTSAALTILTAVDDGGTPATGLSTGLFDITPVFTLNVPGTTPAGSFNTTVVATVVAGP